MTYRFFVGNEEVIPDERFRRDMTDKFAKAFGLERVKEVGNANGKNLYLVTKEKA